MCACWDRDRPRLHFRESDRGWSRSLECLKRRFVPGHADITESAPACGAFLRHTFSPFGTIGMARKRRPMASKIALPIAGAIPTIGASPAPADGRSLRSSSTTSIGGVSLNRGTRYLRETRIEDPAVFKTHRLEERATDSLHDGALDLVLQLIRIDDGAAFERLARRAPRALCRWRDRSRLLRTCARYPPLSKPTRETDAATFAACVPPVFCASQIVSRRLPAPPGRADRADSSDGIRAGRASRVRQFIDVHFAGEVIRGRGERAIRALPQRRLRG